MIGVVLPDKMKIAGRVLTGLRTDGHSVYRVFRRKLCAPDFPFPNGYLEDLRRTVSETVSPETWTLITKENRTENAEYVAYIEQVRREFIREFGYQDIEEQVRMGLYHGDMYVISFPKRTTRELPYYYRGIQLRPYEEKQGEPADPWKR